MSGIPKLNMGTVKEEKKKKTLKKQLSKMSGKLKRGLTPRGSRNHLDIEEPVDSGEDLSRNGSDDTATLTGALGPRESVNTFASDTDESTTVPDSGAYSVLPSEQSVPDAGGVVTAPTEEIVPAAADVAASPAAVATPFAAPPAPAANTYESPYGEDPPPPLQQAPPAEHEPLPQFEHASSVAKEARAMAVDPIPDTFRGAAARTAAVDPMADAAAAQSQPEAEDAAAAMVQNPLSAPATTGKGGRAKWKDVLVAVSVFALGVIAVEPAQEAWRKRAANKKEQVDLPFDDPVARRKGLWGFA